MKNAEREPLSIDEIGDRLVAEFKKLTPEQREQSFERLMAKLRAAVGSRTLGSEQ